MRVRRARGEELRWGTGIREQAEAAASALADGVGHAGGVLMPTLAIVGRRNVGKSTLLNALADAPRAVTGALPGLTREPVEVTVQMPRLSPPVESERRQRRPEGGQSNAPSHESGLATADARVCEPAQGDISLHVRLVDTAGLRPASEVHKEGDPVEASVREHTLSAIKAAHVVAFVMDVAELVDAREAQERDNPRAEVALARADLRLIRLAIDEGKGVILVFNKFEALPPALRQHPRKLYGRIRSKLPRWIVGGSGSESGFEAAVSGRTAQVPILLISAREGDNIEAVRRQFVNIYDKWNTTIPNPVLRRWLEQLQLLRPPPAPLSLRYMRQIASRPPTFALFVGRRK